MKPSKKILAAASALLIVLIAAFLILKPKQQPTAPVIKTVAVAPPTATDTLIIDKAVTPEEEKTAPAPKVQVKQVAYKPAPEKFNPNKYLVKTIKTRKNIMGKTVIEGTVTNSSSNMTFKDIIIDVSYLSKTEANISTQRFVVYEIVQPGKKVPFKFKAKAPDGTKSFETKLVDASIVK